MLTDNDIKEQLSYAYLHAVAAHAGCSCERRQVDRESVDATVRGGRMSSPGVMLQFPTIDVQLKAHACAPISGSSFSYSLRKKNYEDLPAKSMSPRILVVLILPEGLDECLKIDVDQLLLKRAAYWTCLTGAPASANATAISIKVPTHNLMSPSALMSLMEKASRQIPFAVDGGKDAP
ncbi:MAG: DUF4365 domain-containing protein [Candidatus Brocadiae bacterium]|nr:DUF4365 domain-containing protein [Candidatus Brocadiia bacterium]